ncbi:ribbon-helix-helix protein [Vibrio phage 1.170.O._10N.261.52.C3]|nr:ribbon-helix-helix protein [Vibrio phage 1.170.O._10N.261.52.C3]
MNEEIVIEVSESDYETLKTAAGLLSMTVEDFVMISAVKEAEDVIVESLKREEGV